MTGNKGILSTLHSVSPLLPVTLIDGFTSYTEGVGTTNATQFLSLSYILYVSNFRSILLSVNRLIKSLNYSITFFPDLCVFCWKIMYEILLRYLN